MEQDFFEFLPSEIITDILSRLAVRTIVISKSVCKSWLDLVESDEFAKFYLSRSAGALALLTEEGNTSTRCAAFELEGEIDADDHRYNHLTEFDIPRHVTIRCSANGILLLQNIDLNPQRLYVWNPISREYIELDFPRGFFTEGDDIDDDAAYGFGASKISGQHKVVCFKHSCSDCHVYTLGTGSWRRVEAPRIWAFVYYINGVFVNGNLHWAACPDRDSDTVSIYRFDLETECFSILATPPLVGYFHNLSALRDCLCLSDGDTSKGLFVIWLMKENGDEKSWWKECVINIDFDWRGYVYRLYPMKVFRNGDILMVSNERLLTYYSTKTKTITAFGDFDRCRDCKSLMLFTPSFLSLKNYQMENVISL